MQFECKLVQDGICVEFFFREGLNASEVLEGLEMFQWPNGEWKITEMFQWPKGE